MDEREVKEKVIEAQGELEETLQKFNKIIDEIVEMDDCIEKAMVMQTIDISLCTMMGCVRSGHWKQLQILMSQFARAVRTEMSTVPKGIVPN